MKTEAHRLAAVAAVLVCLATGARADVVVGVAGPMSGAFAPIGAEIEAGVRAAVASVNASGGIDGETLTVEVVDDKCDAETGAAVANQLVGRGARLVVGHACTAAALPAARVYADNGILLISPAATNPRFTDERVGASVFRMAPRSDAQARAIADHLLAATEPRRVGFVHDGSAYGQGLAEAVRTLYEAGGGRAVVTDVFTPGEKSQNALAGRIQDAGLTDVVIGAQQGDAAVIAEEMRRRGLPGRLIGGDALGLEEFVDLAGEAADGVLFALPRDWTDAADPAAVAALSADGAPATTTALLARAAVEAYAAAASAGGTAAPEAVAARLAEGGLPTVIGPVSFDAKGDLVGAGYRLHRWEDRRLVPAE